LVVAIRTIIFKKILTRNEKKLKSILALKNPGEEKIQRLKSAVCGLGW
jgi:hypothetical protein